VSIQGGFSHMLHDLKEVWTGRQNCGAVVKICRPVLPNFSHWTALNFCTAFQNFTKYCGQARNQGKHLGHSPPPKISKHYTAILTFAETFKG